MLLTYCRFFELPCSNTKYKVNLIYFFKVIIIYFGLFKLDLNWIFPGIMESESKGPYSSGS